MQNPASLHQNSTASSDRPTDPPRKHFNESQQNGLLLYKKKRTDRPILFPNTRTQQGQGGTRIKKGIQSQATKWVTSPLTPAAQPRTTKYYRYINTYLYAD